MDLSADVASSVLGTSWTDGDSLTVSIDMAFAEAGGGDPPTWTRMISGPVDRVTSEPLSGLVVLEGRDNAAKLIDLPLQDGYLNQTASEVVKDLGSRCGLDVDADPTTGLIGQYYQIQHSKTVFGAYSKHANGWDLLSELAQIQNYDLWVDGTTLHFREPSTGDEPFVVAIEQSGSGQTVVCSVMNGLSLERTIGVSGPLQVRVASWNSRQKQTIAESYPAGAADDAKIYNILKPNLLPDQAQSLAETTYDQIRARQRSLSGWMPGELTLLPRRTLKLIGTGTAWDTLYVIDQISRQISTERGFIQHVTAITIPEET